MEFTSNGLEASDRYAMNNVMASDSVPDGMASMNLFIEVCIICCVFLLSLLIV